MLASNIEMPEDTINPSLILRAIVNMKMHVIPKTNMLFMKGLLRTTMAYTVPACVDETTLTVNLKLMTMDTPFECSTELDFNISPPTNPTPRLTLKTTLKGPCYP